MRPTCIDMVFELAKRDPRVVYIGSDLSPDLVDRMKKEMPGRDNSLSFRVEFSPRAMKVRGQPDL